MINKNVKTVLIIEDEFMALEYLKDILHLLDFKDILKAKNAKDALVIIENNIIDLVFMDINIEGKIDGITCAKLINNIRPTPILYTTAYVDDETIEEANLTNIYGYIMKPFTYKDVKSVLSIALNFINNKNEQEKPLDKEFSSNKISLNDNYSYCFNTQILSLDNTPVSLTKRETAIIELLCINLNQTVSYQSLILDVWEDKDVVLSTIRDAISRLKKKVPELNINNTPGTGYSLII